ncbi:Mitogen-activated protein kinase kinase kinase 7 [Tyrophagus putrescentiae]|nr:Mitogen-activated protein kinase kinase kinase 7 [Tyrophagus putrescentiae]
MFQSNYNYPPYGTNASAISNFSSTSNYHHHDFEFNGFNYIPPEEIEIFNNELLGNGSFGYVKKARWKGQIVAVKFQMEATQFKTEAEQLAKISHENIITVYGHSIQNDNYDGLILKICDFGTACDKKTIMTNNKGSSAWMAPEVFKGNDYSEKCDVFSWAIILWQCLSRRQPFSKYDNEYAIQWSKVALGKKPPLLKNCPSKLKNLLECCWNQDPAVRLSMNEIVPIMEELYSHCEPATLYPLKLVPTTNVKEAKVFISNFNNSLNNSNSSNGSNFFNRRISDDNLVSRDTVEHKPNYMTHKRSCSTDAGVFLGDLGPSSSSHGTVVNGGDSIEDSENDDARAEVASGLLRNFNAYLVLDERHWPGQPDIKNSESIILFEEHKQEAVKLLRNTFEIARLESYLKDLQKWDEDPDSKDTAAIYMRFVDENRNLKKLNGSFIDQLSRPRESRSNSSAQQQQQQPSLEVGGWIMVLALAFVFLNLWTFFDAEALPPGPYFHLFSIFISSLVCAKLSYLLNLPPLFRIAHWRYMLPPNFSFICADKLSLQDLLIAI